MKVRKGSRTVKLPPVGTVERVIIQMKPNLVFPLSELAIEDLLKRRVQHHDIEGCTLYWALSRGDHVLHLFPAPGVGVVINVSYYPPMVVI